MDGVTFLLGLFGALLTRIENSPSVRVEFVGAERFSRAAKYFRRHSDHGYSFTDCTSIVTMQELKRDDVLTTDHRFVEAGLRPLLPVA
jgi:predicted nucleic acid-binding protein